MKKNKLINRVPLNDNPPSNEEESIIKMNLFNRYLEIKQDLINNIKDVFNRSNYYTKKYRGNIVTDINIGLDYDENLNKVIQIYIKHRGVFVKDRLIFNEKGIINSEIKTNIYE